MLAFPIAADTVVLNIDYSQGNFSHEAVASVAEIFKDILSCILVHPRQPISQLLIANDRDYQQLLTWNGSVNERSDACVHHFIEVHALQNPKWPAVHAHDGHVTYTQLDHLSTKIAGELRALGVGPEILAPICFEKSMWAVIAMVAILKAGGAFVPLDPSHPVDRLFSIITRTRAALIVTSAIHSKLFAEIPINACIVGQPLVDSIATTNEVQPRPKVHPNNAAFVLFTSGSTGQPKGIIQEHGSVCANSIAHGEALGMSSASRVLQFAAYTFDDFTAVSMMDIFTTPILGGCVCVPSEYDRMNDITEFINVTQVNWALLTPSFSNLLKPKNVPSLATLALGGEAVTEGNIRRWPRDAVLLNCYGPAECGACIVSAQQMDENTRPEVIGQRLPGALCWLTDPSDHERLTPIGSIGELCVEGPTLARRYLGDPLLTQRHFIENPAWLKNESHRRRRLYKTGDLLRQNSNGTFQFVGRVDSQVKLRGQRVELGEVEHNLSSNASVASCLVAHSKSANSALEIVAPEDPHTLTTQLSNHLQERLPPYMIPNVWIMVKDIPLSASAKIDRTQVIMWLTALDHQVNVFQGHNGFEPAFDQQVNLEPHEVTAIDISKRVAKILGLEKERGPASFAQHNFDLTATGMDSIQAIGLAMSICRHHSVKIGVEHLTNKNITVRDVAKHVEELKQGQCGASTDKLDIGKEWRSLSQKLKDRALEIVDMVKRYC